MSGVIFRGLQYADDLFGFISGEDFPWTQPDWTVSQFTHHWRRENVYPFTEGEVEATVISHGIDPGDGEVWRILVERSRHRSLAILYGRVAGAIEAPFSDGGGVRDDIQLTATLRRRLRQDHLSLLRTIDAGSKDDLRGLLSQMRTGEQHAQAAYFRCEDVLRDMDTTETQVTFIVGRRFPPERLLYETYRQSPRELWRPTKGFLHPFSVVAEYQYGERKFRMAKSDYHNLRPPMSRPSGWETPTSFGVLGPRMLDWGLMEVIEAIRDSGRKIPFDYAGLYVLPAREGYEADRPTRPLPGQRFMKLRSINVVPIMKQRRRPLLGPEDRLDAGRLRRCWSALTDEERARTKALVPDAWVHHDFGLREYRLLAALKYLPTCRSLDGYKEAHRKAEIEVGLREMERMLTPDSDRYDDIPF